MKYSQTTPRKTGRPLSFNRDDVLEKAMLTFWRHGYETTSIHDLTTAMGVTAPSLYAAFGDKKHLFLEAMRLYAGSTEALQTTLDKASSSREAALNMLLTSARTFTGENTPRGCLLASATASVSKDALDVQESVAAVRHDIRARLEARIERDIKEGLLPKHVHAATYAAMTIALIQGMSVLARDGIERDTLERMAEKAIGAWPH